MSAPRRTALWAMAMLWGIASSVWILIPSARAEVAAAAGASMDKFDEGKQAFKAGRFAEALTAYQTSMALEPSPNTRFQIAKCYVALGKTASAFSNFKRAAQEAQDRVNATQEKRYAATREAALSEAAALEKKVPHLTLRVTATAPEGFAIELDGAAVPQPAWGLALEVDPGEHTAVATGPRLQRWNQTFALAEGEQKQIDIPLNRTPTATLRFELKSKPAGLAISLDDQALSPEQYGKPQLLDVGTHRIVGSAPGYRDFQWSGFLADGESATVPIALRAGGGGGPPKWATFVVGGVSLVALAVGLGFGVRAQNNANDQQMLSPLLRDPAVQDHVKTDAIVANTMFAIGGVLAINTVILAATTHWRGDKAADGKSDKKSDAKKDAKRSAWRLAPVISSGSFGLSLSGRY